jgi:hypothetical protein
LIKVFKNEDNTYMKDNVIGDRKYRRGNNKWTIQRNWQHWAHKTKKNKTKDNTKCVGHHYSKQTQIT